MLVESLGGPRFRARQLFDALYRQRHRALDDISNLPKSFRSRLSAQGMVAGSERLVRGPFGLQSIYTLGEGDVLQLGGRIVGVAADVRDQGVERTRLVVVYPDGAAAARAFENLRQHLDSYLKPVTSRATRLVFRDFENKFGVATVNARTIELTFHLAKAPQDSAAHR